MKIKSVSGLNLFVKDLGKTAKFYEGLGFDIKKREADHISAYSNWFWIDFWLDSKDNRRTLSSQADLKSRGGGVSIFLSVDDVDGFHKALKAKGMKPAGAPADEPSGNREFVVRDPDGYNLVIFKRK